ncbi:MAG: flotillin family protein [Opitutaceae bacterium]|jgi:flotillin|nr:flotillin family protein [Opitutaceae bacterium]
MNTTGIMNNISILLIPVGIVLGIMILIGIIRRYRMCPPDRVLVVYGKIFGKGAARCYNGGATFVMPVFQSYSYLSLAPITIEIPLRNALSSQNIRINAPANFAVAISNDPEIMGNAATRLLGKTPAEIAELAREIITGQMRVVIATMTIEEINADREKLISLITTGVEVELRKIGLHLINCNVTDITDESGYIDALGKEAAAKAINDAQIKVAQENQRGAIGRAEAERLQAIRVAEAEAEAAIGRNRAQQTIVTSQAELAEKQAEGERRAEAAQKTAKAEAERLAFEAQKNTEDARAKRDEAAAIADQVAQANAAKEKIRVDAEARATQAKVIAGGQADAARIAAEGEAAAIRTKAEAEAAAIAMKLTAEAKGKLALLEAEAKGRQALLDAQADGLAKFTQGGRDAAAAIHLILAQQVVEVARVQSDAIQKLKFDKIVVMGGGDAGGTAGAFVQDLYKNVLPLHEVAKAAGVTLPGFLGAAAGAEKKAPSAPEKKPAP